jgi:phosphatidylserine synthase
MVILSYLMVSTISFPSPKQIHLRGRKPFDMLVAVVITCCILFAFRRALDLLVFIGFFLYLILSVGYSTSKPRSAWVSPKAVPEDEDLDRGPG